MEYRNTKLIINSAGGTAAKNSKTYKITIPSAWVNELKLDKNNRNIELKFDGKTISLQAQISPEEFAKEKYLKGHNIMKLSFYNDNMVCSIIYADFTDKTLKVKNYIENVVKLPFGNNFFPLWEDFENFLSERCVPKERSGIREYLEALGIQEYNTIEIIKKTKGRMAEDNQWIEMETYVYENTACDE